MAARETPLIGLMLFYKLYSAKNLIVNQGQISSFNPEAVPSAYAGSTTFGSAGDLASDWDQYPSIFTDLNAPVMVTDPSNPGTTSPEFPIVDPRATIPLLPVQKSNSGTTLVSAANWGLIEGFSYTTNIDGAVNTAGSTTIGGATIGADTDRLPMPARWIYVLQDGTLTVPDSWTDAKGNPGAQWTTASGVEDSLCGKSGRRSHRILGR